LDSILVGGRLLALNMQEDHGFWKSAELEQADMVHVTVLIKE
jgi:hypothetical protein